MQMDLFSFSDSFLHDHAGSIVKDPFVAITEMIANSYDAGATRVDVSWPTAEEGLFSITDNGAGLTEDEFVEIWCKLSVKRRALFGDSARIPPSHLEIIKSRKAFGKNGKGRHAPFCFAVVYKIETKSSQENATLISKSIQRSSDTHKLFEVENNVSTSASFPHAHGTRISGTIIRNSISVNDLIEIIESKFLLDPTFKIFVNNVEINLSGFNYPSENITVDEHEVTIYTILADGYEKKSRAKGVAWWVNGRLVGQPSWEKQFSAMDFLDARYSIAKRLSFIVKADFLDNDVTTDWSGFQKTPASKSRIEQIERYLDSKILSFFKEDHEKVKMEFVNNHISDLKEFSRVDRFSLGLFVDEVLETCKTISARDLDNIVQVFLKLESSKSGYNIIQRLSECSPDDIDKWNEIMENWNASQAQTVFNLIHKRAKIIEKLLSVVNDRATDELHDIHYVIDKELWIFGPQYEGGFCNYASNKQLNTIIDQHFGGDKTKLENERKRPDIVAYTQDAPSNGINSEYSNVLIIEFKRGGFELGDDEVNQGMKYAKELKRAGAISTSTPIDVIVLGSTLKDCIGIQKDETNNIKMIPSTYSIILNQADQRLYYLRKRIEELGYQENKDEAIEKALSGNFQQQELIVEIGIDE